MKVHYQKPADRISEYVQDILIIENYQVTIPFCLPLFANGTPTLLFHTVRGRFNHNAGHLTLFGQTISPDKLQIDDNFTLVAYFLKPHSLTALFGISAQELTDRPVDLNLLSKRTDLHEQLLNADSVHTMILLMDTYIFSLVPKGPKCDPLVEYVTKKIADSPTTTILTELQKDFCITERTLQRMFEKNIGVSPNKFRKISQFNNAFRQLNRRQFRNLSDIAYDNGYADQSHYIQAFKEFTKITPSAYLHLSAGSI